MELDISTHLFPDRRSFLGLAGFKPEPKMTIHGVNYTENYVDEDKVVNCVEIYVDQICFAAYFHFPDEFEAAVISMLSEEILTEICMLQPVPRFHSEDWMNTWLKISVIDEVLKQAFSRSFAREARNRSAGSRVLRHLRR